MSYSSLLNLTCTIKARTTTYSAIGASTVTYADKATGEKCGIQPNVGGVFSREESEELNITNLGFYLIGSTIVETDKVVASNGNEYIVKKVNDAAGRARHFEVGLELLEKA